MGIQPKTFPPEFGNPQEMSPAFVVEHGVGTTSPGEVGGVRTSKITFPILENYKAGGLQNDGPFWKKVTPALKYLNIAIHFWYSILDFMGCTFSLPANQTRKWMAWLGRYLSFWFRCQFLVVVIPLFSWRDSAKIPGRVDLKLDHGGPEGGPVSHVPKQDSCFFVFGNMEISLFIRHFFM